MTESLVRCGNPQCPEQPEIIPDNSMLADEDRRPCPVCGSRARAVVVVIAENASMTHTIEPPAWIPQNHMRRPIPLPPVRRGRTSSPPYPSDTTTKAPPTRSLGWSMLSLVGLPVTHEIFVRYADLQVDIDAPCVIEVCSMGGEVLAHGGGLTPADALSAMFEQMLPPTSTEFIDTADEPDLPDDE